MKAAIIQRSVAIRLLIGIFFLIPVMLQAQQGTRIQLVRAGVLEGSQSQGVKRFIDDVVFEHEGTFLYCDSAHLFDNNSLNAFGNVRIKGDTLDIHGDMLHYDGNTRIAEMMGNVVLQDPQLKLTTPSLWYDLDQDIGRYTEGGTIVDDENELSSSVGYYYAQRKEFYFRDDVVLENPDYRMDSDTLLYYTESEVAYFYGPTVIRSEENIIYCENGWYDTKNDISEFSRNAWLSKDNQKIKGDSLYYDRSTGFGRAIRNVSIVDTAEGIVLYGHRGLYFEREGVSLMTDSTVAVLIEDEDSLFLHADTLKLFTNDDNEAELLLAYRKAKFFRKDMQGYSDSLAYHLSDSVIFMYHDPVLWSSNYQLTSSLIELKMRNEKLDSLILHDPAMIGIIEDKTRYNQVKGRRMSGRFKDNELRSIYVEGNAESVYYLRDDEDNSIIGINKAESSMMMMYFEDKELSIVTLIKDPKEVLYRESDLTPGAKLLQGFRWRGDERPRNKEQIFE